MVYNESPIEEVPSFSESEDLHSLYINLFDDDHSHEHPHVYHVVHSPHFSSSDETLNGKLEQEECLALIDQSSFLNGSPSMTHNVINPSQSIFFKHDETQFDIANC